MGMNMDQYTPEFTAKGVDGQQLLQLDSDKLKVRKRRLLIMMLKWWRTVVRGGSCSREDHISLLLPPSGQSWVFFFSSNDFWLNFIISALKWKNITRLNGPKLSEYCTFVSLVFLRGFFSGSRCVEPKWPFNYQEEAERHAEGPGEAGETAREKREGGSTQRETAAPNWLCLLRYQLCALNQGIP